MYQIKDIAIVILNWNGKPLLQRFLPSVTKFSEDALIYVADNGSSDDSIEFLKENYPTISILINTENFGFAGGYNEALKKVSAPIFCLLNNDVEVSEGWLDPILETFNSDPSISIVQPKILDYNRRSHFEYAGAAGGYLDKYGFPYCRGRVFDHIETDKGQYDDVIDILWASGACLFIRKDSFFSLEGFDQSYFAHMEEIDLCWRAFNIGLKTKYNGYSTVYHLGGATLSNSSPQKTYLNFRNSLFTLTKNTDKNLIGRLFFRMVLDGVAGLRFLLQLKPKHFVAVLRAHAAFYFSFGRLLGQRKTLIQRPGYYRTTSIVWSYFILKKTDL